MMMNALLTVRRGLSHCWIIIKHYKFWLILQLAVLLAYLVFSGLPVRADTNEVPIFFPLASQSKAYYYSSTSATQPSSIGVKYDFSDTQTGKNNGVVAASIKPSDGQARNSWTQFYYSSGSMSYMASASAGSVRIRFTLAIHRDSMLYNLQYLTVNSMDGSGWTYNATALKNSYLSDDGNWTVMEFDFIVPWRSDTQSCGVRFQLSSPSLQPGSPSGWSSSKLCYMSRIYFSQIGGSDLSAEDLQKQTVTIVNAVDDAADKLLNADIDTSGVDIPGLDDLETEESSLRASISDGLQRAEQLQDAQNYNTLLSQLPNAFLWCQVFFNNLSSTNPKISLIIQLAGGVALIAVLFSLVGTFIRRKG